MALTLRANGNLISAGWFNDFYNLFTGVMTDQPISFANTVTAQKFAANGTLSSANPIVDLQQGFVINSDNTASVFAGATSRLWFASNNANGTQEVHFGPRGGGTFRLAGFRVLTNNVIFDGSAAGVFKVQGSLTTSLDAGNITTDGNGNITFGGSPILASRQSGAASGLVLKSWSGSAAVVPFSVGGQFSSALSWVDNSGHFHDAAGVVAVQGSHSAGQPIISYGTGAPVSLAANEIYIQIA